jgi:hypothetical protein
MSMAQRAIAVVVTMLAIASPAMAQEKPKVWEKAWIRLNEADSESLNAIKGSIADVEGSFALAASNTPVFVEHILGWDGKWQFAVGMSGQVVNFGAGMMDAIFSTNLGQPAGPDSFRGFARKEFVSVVCDPDVFKLGIENAAKAYVSKLASIENRLLVDMKLDIPDADIRMPRLPVPKLTDALLAQVDAAVDDIIADAATDFGITMAKELVSQVGGNIAAGAVLSSSFFASHGLSNDPFSATVMGTGLVAGLGVSWAVDKVVEAMGHDPTGTLARKLVDRLKRARGNVIEGEDRILSSRYAWLTLFRFAHPDAEVRSLSGSAAARMENDAFLGLQPLLTTVHAERLCARRRMIYHAIFGNDTPEPAELCLHPKQVAESAAVVECAKDYLSPGKRLDRFFRPESLRILNQP